MILYLPEHNSNFSPIIFFEADDDAVDKKLMQVAEKDKYERFFLDGLYFIDEKRLTYDKQEIDEMYYKSEFDDDFSVPNHYNVIRFLTRTLVCFINFQSLNYGNFRKILDDLKDLDGKKFEVAFSKSLNNAK